MNARRLILPTVLILLAAAALGAWLYVRALQPQLELGVGYGARVACSCRYIGNRDLKDCRKDFEPGMEPIQLSENAATKTVTASVPLIASRSVRFDPLLGCQPAPLKR
ncbi:MAG: hypothetical protein B7Y45_01370 [Sphingomonas sp. 28-66-16]|nr:MAG: hypothetical protein B7Y45_01370 [Sphingomonas sp. 28-66-16]